jgi:DNA-binding Lrp family transcriptional regulator
VVRAYILIEMVAGQSRGLVNSLKAKTSVQDVARVTGPYDVIVVLEGKDIDQISNFVTDTIHTLKGVARTTTCVSLA